MAGTGRRLPPRALGSSVAAVAGLVFVVANAGAVGWPGAGALRLVAALAFGACLVSVVRARRAAALPAPARLGRGYWAVVAGEVALILVGRYVLASLLELPDAALPWVTLVVGVHFFALALVLRARFYHLLALVLSGCALTGFAFAFAPGDAATAITVAAGVCPGLVLLAASLWGLRGLEPQPSSSAPVAAPTPNEARN